MKHVCTLLLLIGTWAVAGTIETVTLPLDSRHVTLRLHFKTGSVDDPTDQLGITYLTARMLVDSGTVSLSKEQIDDLLFPTAASFDAVVDKEATVFTTTIHVDHLATVYPVFRDLFTAPRWDPADFKRIKENTLKDLSEDLPNNNDEVLSKNAFYGLMYDGHPYAHVAQGRKSTLEKITLDQVKAHYAAVFTQARLMLGVAGKFEAVFPSTVAKDLTSLPVGTLRKPLAKPAKPEGLVVRIISKPDAFGSAIYMGFPLEANRGTADFAALLVGNSYLGQHRSSDGRLYKEMRGKRSLNYGDYSYVEWYPNGHATQLPASGTPRSLNAFAIWLRPVQIAEQFAGVEGLAMPALGNGVHSVRQSIRELHTLLEKGIPEEAFQRMRTFMSGFVRQYVQNQEERLGFLMDGRMYGRKDYIEEIVAEIDKLTAADVNAALRKHLRADNFYLAIVTDDSEAQKMADCLKTGCSAPIVYKPAVRAGLSAEILAEDKLIDSFPLKTTRAEVVPVDQVFQ